MISKDNMTWSNVWQYRLSDGQCLTHWGRDKMAAVSQTMFSNAFSWVQMYEFSLKFHWSLFLRFQLTIFQHWFRYWLGAVQATSHYLNQWWLVYWRIYTSLGLNELRTDALMVISALVNTVLCLYIQHGHGCLLWVWSLIYILLSSSSQCWWY